MIFHKISDTVPDVDKENILMGNKTLGLEFQFSDFSVNKGFTFFQNRSFFLIIKLVNLKELFIV